MNRLKPGVCRCSLTLFSLLSVLFASTPEGSTAAVLVTTIMVIYNTPVVARRADWVGKMGMQLLLLILST